MNGSNPSVTARRDAFVGRGAELAELAAALERARAGNVSDDVAHPYGALLYGMAAFTTGADALWGEERTRAALAEAGFGAVTVRMLAADPLHGYYTATRI